MCVCYYWISLHDGRMPVHRRRPAANSTSNESHLNRGHPSRNRWIHTLSTLRFLDDFTRTPRAGNAWTLSTVVPPKTETAKSSWSACGQLVGPRYQTPHTSEGHDRMTAKANQPAVRLGRTRRTGFPPEAKTKTSDTETIVQVPRHVFLFFKLVLPQPLAMRRSLDTLIRPWEFSGRTS